eukprot:scaffold757_cov246-Pinguiococcus_pyrenoidosus.AAC.2
MAGKGAAWMLLCCSMTVPVDSGPRIGTIFSAYDVKYPKITERHRTSQSLRPFAQYPTSPMLRRQRRPSPAWQWQICSAFASPELKLRTALPTANGSLHTKFQRNRRPRSRTS